jgi:hypothetical protein
MSPVVSGTYVVRVSGSCGELSETINVTEYKKTEVRGFSHDTTLCYGSPIELKAIATGDNLKYIWCQNGLELPENTNTLNIASVDYASAGQYSCKVSGTCGETTVMMILSVDSITKINTISADTILCPDEPLSLKVDAEGTGLTYQWERDGKVLIGETSSEFSMNEIVSGTYVVRVSGSCGELSDTINVAEYKKTEVRGFSHDTTLCYGSPIELKATATGDNLKYIWCQNGLELPESTNTLNIASVDYASAGQYSCKVSGTCGETTVMMILSVDTITKINSISSDTVLCSDEPLSLKVDAEGTGLTYQWERDGKVLIGETTSVLDMSPVVAGTYVVRVSGSCGELSETINVGEYKKTEVSGFSNDTTLCYGSPIELKAIATGDNLKYTWCQNGLELSEKTNRLNIPSVDYTSAGQYSCKVSGTCGETTVMMILSVDTLTNINSISSDTVLCPDEPLSLKVDAEGTGLTYQWERDGKVLSGETSLELSMNEVIAGTYVVRVSGSCGELSETIKVEEYKKTEVSGFSHDTTLCYGSPIELKAIATGDNLKYTWCQNGIELPEKTNTLNIPSVDYLSAGQYSCKVSGTCGETTVMMIMSVDSITKINTISSDTVICPEEPLSLKVDAEGTGLTYQWERDGKVLIGETSSELSMNEVIAGTYVINVKGSCGELSETIKVEEYKKTEVSGFSHDTTLCYGSSIELKATATGDNLKYTWCQNGFELPEKTNTLNIASVDYTSAGQYSCQVLGVCGDTTLVMNLAVDTLTKINSISSDTLVCSEEPLSLTVDAEGTGLIYQWERDGKILTGETTSVLDMSPVIAGTYVVNVKGSCGELSGTINVEDYNKTEVSGFSNDTTLCYGSPIELKATATGDNLKYIWKQNGIELPEKTNTLNIASVDESKAGQYSCIVSGTGGDTTLVMTLKVQKLTKVLNITGDKEECEGSFVQFKVDAEGDELKYNWSHDYLDFKSDKSEIFLNNLSEKHAGRFTCNVSGACGDTTVYTNLYVNELTKIVTHTNDTVVCEGGKLKLDVEANGSFLDYEWYMNKTEVDEHSHVLYLNNLKRKDSMLFDCIVSGICGDTTVSMKVKVGGFELLTKDTDTTLCVGESLNYTVLADVCDDSYEWFHNGKLIENKTKSFEINQIQEADGGEYKCHVMGTCGDSTIVLNLNVIDVPELESEFDAISVVAGENIDLNFKSYGKKLKYIWRFGKDTLDNNCGSYSIKNADFDDEGTYECIVCNKCGEDRRSINVKVLKKTVILNSTPDTSVCENESITMAVEAEGDNLIYGWYHKGKKIGIDNKELDIVNADTTQSGLYTCIVNGDGGSDTCSIYFTVHALPRASITGDMDVCNNSTNIYEAVDVTEKVDYMWSVIGGDVIGDRDNISCTAVMDKAGKGKVSIQIISKTTACSNIIESDINVNSLPVVDFDYRDTIGYCETALQINGGTPLGGKYLVDGMYSDTIYYKKGVYEHELIYEVTDAKTSCINRDTIKVVRADNPYVILEDSVKIGACKKYQIKANVSSGKYEWSNGSNLDDIHKENATFTPGKTSICKLMVTDEYGCEAEDSIKIVVADAPQVKAIQDTVIGICNELELDCSLKTDGDYNVEWSPKESLNKTGNKTAKVICDESGIKTYTVSVTDEYGCCDSDSVKVEIKRAPELGDDKYCCYGDTLNINFDKYYSVVWKDDFEGSKRKISEVGEYHVRVCDEFGCKDSVMMNVIALPEIILNDTVIYEGESIDLEPQINDKEGVAYMCWQDGSTSYFYNASKQGYYTVEVENSLGCKSKKSMFLTVKKIYLAAPNAFNPVSSGDNNRFYLKDKDFKGDFEMILFDRWGTEIYRTKELGKKGGWNGEYNGLKCQPGAYIWVVYVNGKFWGKGYVMIVK